MERVAIEGAERAFNITPSDSVGPTNSGIPADIPYARRLYIGQAGTLKIVTHGGDTITYVNVAVGYLYVAVIQVFFTGTSAADIVGEY